EHGVVEQEEARQPEPVDHAQLLLQASPSLLTARAGGGGSSRAVALLQPRAAKLGQAAGGALVLGPRIAVAEGLRQVERQLLGEPQRLADRLGMVTEAAHHCLRSAPDVAGN